MLNLLSNACKFTRSGIVGIDSYSLNKGNTVFYVIEVSDTGVGMKSDQCVDVFKLYTQADSSTTKEYGGTGLGLTISKQYCEMMGGSIEVSSVYGKGSTFVVKVPLQDSADVNIGQRKAG